MLPGSEWLSHHLEWAGVSSFLVLCLLALSTLLMVQGLLCAQRYYIKCRSLKYFPQPPVQNWFFGHMKLFQFSEESLQYMTELGQQYTDVHVGWLWFLPVVRVFHPQVICPMLKASGTTVSKNKLTYDILKPWLGDGLLLKEGKRWRKHRNLLNPAFHFDILKSYVKVFNQSVDILHAKWKHLWTEGHTRLDMFEHISLLTLDILQKCIFGHNSNCQENSSTYISAILELSSLVVKRLANPLLYWDVLYNLSGQGRRFSHACRVVHDFSSNIIRERRRILTQQGAEVFIRSKGKSKTMDFIDILLLTVDEDGKALSDKDIQAEADTFIFGGFDTTTSAISWALCNLAQNQEHQDRCREEIEELLRGRQPEEIEWDDLAQMPFLTMCIKESLRLCPPVPSISRCCAKDIQFPDGRVIPKETICTVSIFGTHHNPALWPNPEVYDPYRFDTNTSQKILPWAFIPFSAGPRNCIGQNFAMTEIKVVLALTLLRFRILPDEHPPKKKAEIILRAENGLWLKVEPL